MIEIKSLSKNFNDLSVLSNINLSIQKGQIYGLVGRSGAGKSTLLRCINRLENFDSGNLIVNGIDIKSLDPASLRGFRKNVAMIFQQTSVLERKSVFENVIFPMQCWGVGKAEQESKARELIKLVNLEDKIDIKTQNLSGGQKQRVAIARALTLEPSILLCDEATSALDPNTTQSILTLLKEINLRLGITIVVVTHEMQVVRALCDKVAILECGKIVQNGDPSDVFMSGSDALNRLLGSFSYQLKDGLANVEIISILDTKSAEILSDLARDLNLKFQILDGTVEHFIAGSFTKFVIGFELGRLEETAKYLTTKGIKFQILKDGK